MGDLILSVELDWFQVAQLVRKSPRENLKTDELQPQTGMHVKFKSPKSPAILLPGDFLVIYFVRSPAMNAIKIGVAGDPLSRIRDLQVGCPDAYELLGTIEGGRLKEQELHRQFAHLRILGEWFRAEKELLGAIDLLTHFSEFATMPQMGCGREKLADYLRDSHRIEIWVGAPRIRSGESSVQLPNHAG